MDPLYSKESLIVLAIPPGGRVRLHMYDVMRGLMEGSSMYRRAKDLARIILCTGRGLGLHLQHT